MDIIRRDKAGVCDRPLLLLLSLPLFVEVVVLVCRSRCCADWDLEADGLLVLPGGYCDNVDRCRFIELPSCVS